MTYTLQNIHTAPSYDALKRNGFTDLDIIAYYGTPIANRGAMLNQIKNNIQVKKIVAPKVVAPTIENQGTQMCTGLFNRVDAEFKRLMKETFIVKGGSYNLSRIGYTMGWNSNRNRAGVHKIRRKGMFGSVEKRIELSRWVLEHSDKTFDKWVNTILHEIAHAIDYEIRGTSDHSYRWQSVALSIGCDGKRCYTAKVNPKASKYTVKCTNCGHEQVGHKFSKVIERGHKSCGKCMPNKYDARYKLIQIQNY